MTPCATSCAPSSGPTQGPNQRDRSYRKTGSVNSLTATQQHHLVQETGLVCSLTFSKSNQMQRSGIFFLCVVVLSLVHAAPPANHGLSTTFTKSDVDAVTTFLQSQAETSDIHSAYFATQALARLELKPNADKTKQICKLAKDTLADKSVAEKHDAKSIYHAAALAQLLKCDVTVDKPLTDAIKAIIEEGASVPNYYYAVNAALSIRDKTKKDISDDVLTSVVDKLGDLTESDGTVRSTTEDKEGDLYNTGLVLQLYARIITELKLSEQDKEHVDELVNKVENILDLANEGDNKLSFSSEDSIQSTLATTAEIVRGFSTLGHALKKGPLDVTPTQLAQLGEYFLSHKYASTVEDAFYLLSGLRAVQQSPKSPLALTVEKSSILSTAKGAEGDINVRLTDIFDTPVAGKVTLIKSHALGKPDAILLNNQEVKDNTLHFLAVKPEQGFYALEFRAVPTDIAKYATIDSAPRRIKVIGSVSVTDFELAVSDSRETRGSEGAQFKADYPNTVSGSIAVARDQYIHISFRVRNAGGSTTRPLTAQQAFIRFVNAKTGHETVFVATPNDNKVYSTSINVQDVARSQFNSQGGEYIVSVVVGDSFIQNPVSWTVSKSLSLNIGNGTSSSPSSSSYSALKAKPEILHKYRLAETRPNQFTSTLFTGITLAPIAILFIGFVALGANISKFPFTDSDFFSAVAFVVTIALNLLLIAVYWLFLNLVQTLGYLAVLSIPTIFFGNRALSALARKEK